MRQIRHLLRLAHEGVSTRQIGRALGIASSTVQDNLGRARVAGLTWPLAPELTDEMLEGRLFLASGKKAGFRRLPNRTGRDWRAS